MILYDSKNVYEAALDRVREIYSWGKPVVVAFSGGKDSTALLHVTLEVAKELGIKKVPVLFIDQECEYTEAINYMKHVMALPEVEPYWIQVPFRLWNANNGSWFTPWEVGKEWMREKEECSYKENVYGADRFKEIFDAIALHHFGADCIKLGGVRIEESLSRRVGLLQAETLPGITWGKRDPATKIVTLYPLYDWSFRDIWYYIFENRFEYCKVYNKLFSKYPLSGCRVSSLIHENSNANIGFLQEVDPDAYNAMYKRIPAIGTTNHLLLDVFETLKDVPQCFNGWVDYAEYLVEHLISEEKNRAIMQNSLTKIQVKMNEWGFDDKARRDILITFVRGILTEDFVLSKLNNAIGRHKRRCVVTKAKAKT